jgi:hypothetical protein
MVVIWEVFEDKIFSRELAFHIPRSQFCDFYLWGNLKGKVYKNNLHSTEALQNEITHIIGSVTMDQLQNMSHNLLCDVRHVCKQKRVIFSTRYKSTIILCYLFTVIL